MLPFMLSSCYRKCDKSGERTHAIDQMCDLESRKPSIEPPTMLEMSVARNRAQHHSSALECSHNDPIPLPLMTRHGLHKVIVIRHGNFSIAHAGDTAEAGTSNTCFAYCGSRRLTVVSPETKQEDD